MNNQEKVDHIMDKWGGVFKKLAESDSEPALHCKLCGVREQKDPAGYSNISYATGICIDCLMNWR